MSITTASDFPFTTPYVQPNSCWDLIGGSRGRTVTRGTTYYEEATDLYTECLPPSWRTIPPESRYSPSPAVCPRGWRYWNIATSEVSSQLVTTAYCCDYYKELYPSDDYPLDGYSKPCLQIEEEIYVHIPWHVTWQESDIPNLNDQPPTVDPAMMIPTWLPGVIGAGPPEQVPLPTPVLEPTHTPEPSTTLWDSPPLVSSSANGSSSTSSAPGPSPTPGSSQTHQGSLTGDPALEQNGSSTQELTSTNEPSLPEESPTFISGASIYLSAMTLHILAKLAIGLTLSVGLGLTLRSLDEIASSYWGSE